MSEEISQTEEELGQEEMAQLVKKVLEEGKPEANFILKIEEWNRPGPSFADYGKLKVLHGEIHTIELDSQYDYPTTNSTTYAVIPLTKVVIALFKWGDDFEGELKEHAELYVFTLAQGWKSMPLY